MKRFNLVKGIAMSLVAMFLVTGLSMPVNAEKIQETEVTELGAAKVPTIKIKNTKQTGDLVEAWTIGFDKIPEGCELYFNLYDEDKRESLTGEWLTDATGKEFFKAWYYSAKAGDTEFVLNNNMITMGKKTLEAYFIDRAEYTKAVKEWEAKCKAIDDKHNKAMAEYNAACAKWEQLDSQYWIDKSNYDTKKSQYDADLREYERLYALWKDHVEWGPKEEPIPPAPFTLTEPKRPVRPTAPVKEAYPEKPGESEFEKKATNKLTIDVKKTARCVTAVKATSVEIRMADDYVTGYEIYRKVGSKFKKIGKVAKNVFKDKGLSSNTKYTYKVRPYYFDKKLKKTIYGVYCQFETMTIGSPLKLKATISGSKNVKLSWKKVKGAVKYEVYRSVNSSDTTEISKGWGDGYGSGELIKTLGSGAKSYTDKKTVKNQSYHYTVRAVLGGGKKVTISDGVDVALTFTTPVRQTQYVDKYGKKTVEWRKVIGAEGYIIDKLERDLKTGDYVWKEYKKLGKSATKFKFTPPTVTKNKSGEWVTKDVNGNWITHDFYRIHAYKSKGKVVSSRYIPVRVDATLGVVQSVTAKKVDNGIKVSWSKVNGAAYYKVFRIKTGALIKDKDSGCYTLSEHENYGDEEYNEWIDKEGIGFNFIGRQVTEYVGAKAPVSVDVKKWNAAVEAYQKDPINAPKPDYPVLLDPEKDYFYQNYEYCQNKITGTSIIDYSGEIYGEMRNVDWQNNRRVGVTETEDGKFITPIVEVNPKANYSVGPEDGISYQYYVVAVMAEEATEEDYAVTKWDMNGQPYLDMEGAKADYEADKVLYAAIPGTTKVKKLPNVKPIWKAEKTHAVYSLGCKKIGSATFNDTTPPKKTSIKSLKSAKKKVTITFKKSPGAIEYRIYRAEKKKGPFICVGTTSKTKYTDSGLKAGRTYYYKVVAIKVNSAKSDVPSKASAVKSVKVK